MGKCAGGDTERKGKLVEKNAVEKGKTSREKRAENHQEHPKETTTGSNITGDKSHRKGKAKTSHGIRTREVETTSQERRRLGLSAQRKRESGSCNANGCEKGRAEAAKARAEAAAKRGKAERQSRKAHADARRIKKERVQEAGGERTRTDTKKGKRRLGRNESDSVEIDFLDSASTSIATSQCQWYQQARSNHGLVAGRPAPPRRARKPRAPAKPLLP